MNVNTAVLATFIATCLLCFVVTNYRIVSVKRVERIELLNQRLNVASVSAAYKGQAPATMGSVTWESLDE
jgi:hypothetical protein